MIIINPYFGFRYFNDPIVFFEEQLIVSDGMGYESNPAFLIDRSYFNNNLIMYVLCGELYVEQFGRKLLIAETQGVLMDLTKKHRYYLGKCSESHIIWFHFRGKACQGIIDELSKNDKMPMVFTAPWFEKEIYNIFDIARSADRTKEFAISTKIYQMIVNITKPYIIEMLSQSNDFDRFKNNIDAYITLNITKKIRLDEIAGHFNMSRYYFCRQFKENFNTTPFEYIKLKKIEVAKKILINTNDSIVEISNYLSFYDQGYFSNVFKSIVGCSPKDYRKKKLKDFEKT